MKKWKQKLPGNGASLAFPTTLVFFRNRRIRQRKASSETRESQRRALNRACKTTPNSRRCARLNVLPLGFTRMAHRKFSKALTNKQSRLSKLFALIVSEIVNIASQHQQNNRKYKHQKRCCVTPPNYALTINKFTS